MGIIEAVVTVAVAILGAGGIVTIYLKHRLDRERDEERRKREAEAEHRKQLVLIESDIDLAKGKEWQTLDYMLVKIVECLHGEKPNGQLERAHEEYRRSARELELLYKKKRIFLDSEQ